MTPGAPPPFFRFGRLARMVGAALLVLAWAGAAPARAQETLDAKLTMTADGGFGRMVFGFADAPQVRAEVSDGILVVHFSKPVLVDLDLVTATLGDYVSSARRDPDGLAVRLALLQTVTARSTDAGNQVFVDLLPETWTGPPPSLPPEVIAGLSNKARQADLLKAQEAERVAQVKPQSITVRAAQQPTFLRIVFDLPKPVPVNLDAQGDAVHLVFDAPVRADLSPVQLLHSPFLRSIAGSQADARYAVDLQLAPGSGTRGFWDGTDYVLDLSATAANGAKASPEALIRSLGVDGTDLHAADLHAGAGRPAAAAQDAPQDAQAAPARHDTAAEADETPAPEPVKGPIRPDLKVIDQTLRLSFAFEHKTAAAMLARGRSILIVFDTDRAIDVAGLVDASNGLVVSAAAEVQPGSTMLRIRLSTGRLATLTPSGLTWTASIGDAVLGGALPLTMRRTLQAGGQSALTTMLPGVGSVHAIDDRETGQRLLLVTAMPPTRAALKPQNFLELQTLATAQGLAILPKADDVVATLGINEVIVSRDGGLTLSASSADDRQALDPGAHPVLLDVAQWTHEAEAPYRERESLLLRRAALAGEHEQGTARMALARFYLAQDRAPEAAAVLDVATTSSGASQQPELGILLAASRALGNRPAEVARILADRGLSDTPDGCLWRAIAAGDQRQFGLAREDLQQGAMVLGLYPAAVQIRLHFVAYEAALEAADPREARLQRAALVAMGPAAALPRRLLLDARLAELTGHADEADEGYRRAAADSNRAVAAEAELRAIQIESKTGKLDDQGMVDRLETLEAIWRGDEIEARTMKLLAIRYTALGRYRSAFNMMRVALTQFPESQQTRGMQDDMRRTFAGLYLDGGADRLPPVEALALFYDFQDLTPADARGDEMIRKLADRLVAVDLLDQASDLLRHQIDGRLAGAARASVAAKLALIQLMNHKPRVALDVLAQTRQAELPQALQSARMMIEARALSDTARPDLAIEILDQVPAPEAQAIKAQVLWSARRWPDVGSALERLLGDAWQGARPLDDPERAAVMRSAIAYSLAGDALGLSRVRTKFMPKMAGSPDASSFEVVTAPIEVHGPAFADVVRGVAASDQLDSFVRDFRSHYLDPPTTPATPAAAAAAAPAQPPAG